MSLNYESGKWFVQASMRKMNSDTSFIGFLKFFPLNEQREYLSTEKAQEDAEEELTQLFYMIRREG